MFVSHFVGLDLRVEMFFGKERAAENGGVNFELEDIGNSAHLYWSWRNFHANPVSSSFLMFFGDEKWLLKALLTCTKAVAVDFNMKFISKFNHGFTNRSHLHCAILKLCTVLKKKEPTRQELCNFSFKMFKMWFLRFWKCLKTIKHHTHDILILSLLLVIIMVELLRSLMLWNYTYCSCLKLTVQLQLALHPYDLFLINNRNVTGDIVEKYCFAV